MARKLVTIRKLKSIEAIPGADFIVKVKVDGWQCVSKKGEFNEGDYGLYFEIDSFLNPEDSRFEFLAKNGLKTMNGQKGIRLRTMRLRGTLSQGLMLPLNLFPEVQELYPTIEALEAAVQEKVDLSELLGVQKYEPPETDKGCDAAGAFPYWARVTDEERIQNVWDEFSEKYGDLEFTPTLKLDGKSTTMAYVSDSDLVLDYVPTMEDGDQVVVCSRNLALKHNPDAGFWKALSNGDVLEKFVNWCRSNNRQLVVQGETVGPGIQKNREKFNKFTFFVFRIWDINESRFLNIEETQSLCDEIGMNMVPTYESFKPFERFQNIDEILEYAEGDSIHNKVREGLVYVTEVAGERVSFKTISNKFLLKGGD